MGLRSLCQYKVERTTEAQTQETRAEAMAVPHRPLVTGDLGTRTHPTRDPPLLRSPRNVQHGLVMSHPSRVFLQTSKFPIHQCQRTCLSKDFSRASQLQRRSNIKDQKPLTNSPCGQPQSPTGSRRIKPGDITGCARVKPEASLHRVHSTSGLKYPSVNAGGEGFIPREILRRIYPAKIA